MGKIDCSVAHYEIKVFEKVLHNRVVGDIEIKDECRWCNY